MADGPVPATPSGPNFGARVVTALTVVLLLMVIVFFVTAIARRDHFGLRNTESVESAVDGLRYRVHRAHGSPERAADTMAELNATAIALLRRLRSAYVRDTEAAARNPARAQAAKRLLALYSPDNLAENSPRDPDGDTSYVLSKGAVVALCLRERDPALTGDPASHDFHEHNTLVFVVIHEMSHIAIEVLDHPPEFWSTFKFLLLEAAAAGIYTPVNYELAPVQYCGMKVDYNPLFDPALAPS